MKIAFNTCKNYLQANWLKRIDAATALETIPADEIDMEDDTLLKIIMSLPTKYKETKLKGDYYYE